MFIIINRHITYIQSIVIIQIVGPFKIPPSKAREMFNRSEDNDNENNDSFENDNEDEGSDVHSINSNGSNRNEMVVDSTPRISTKEKLRKIVQEERSLIASARKRVAAGKKVNKEITTAKNKTKTGETKTKKNMDKEKKKTKTTKKDKSSKQKNKVDDEEWDIEACYDVPHKERKATTMKMMIFPEKILNIRKGKGWKLELMIKYNTGELLWTFLHGAVAEVPDLTDLFMKDNELNYTVCGYKMDPKMYPKNKKISQYDEFDRNPEDIEKYKEQATVIHNNLKKKTYILQQIAVDDDGDDKTIVSNTKGEKSDNVTPEKLIFEDDDLEEDDEDEPNDIATSEDVNNDVKTNETIIENDNKSTDNVDMDKQVMVTTESDIVDDVIIATTIDDEKDTTNVVLNE